MPVSQLMVCNWLDQPLKSLARILTVPCLWWVLLFGATKGNVASSYHLATPFSGAREFQQRLSEISVLLWFRKVEKCHHLLLLTRGKVLCGYPEIYNKATEAGSAWMSASDSEWAPLLCGKRKKEARKGSYVLFVALKVKTKMLLAWEKEKPEPTIQPGRTRPASIWYIKEKDEDNATTTTTKRVSFMLKERIHGGRSSHHQME